MGINMIDDYNSFTIEGYGVSARIHNLFKNGVINSKEMMLLALVDSYTSEDEDDEREEFLCIDACLLADFLGISEARTHKSIRHLIRLHLLQVLQDEDDDLCLKVLNPKQKGIGLWISEYAMRKFYDGDVNLREAAMLSIIEDFTMENRECPISNSEFAQRLRASIPSVQVMLQHLQKQGLVERIRYDGKIRYLKIC